MTRGKWHGSLGATNGGINHCRGSTITRGSPTLRSKLPVEVLELVFGYLSKPQLIPVLCANRSLQNAAVRLLYTALVVNKPVSSVLLLKKILAQPTLHCYVRSLELNISNAGTLTANFYRLLRRCLRRTTALTTLILDLPKANSPVWIFEGCNFHLRVFSTSMQCNASLARFLDTQPFIRQLTLRGFQTENWDSPHFVGDIVSNPSSLFTPRRNFRDFVLQPNSLPSLTQFNAIHAGPLVIEAVAKGRPISVASVPLFSDTALQSLDALKGGSAALKRLSVISFDPTAPNFIFEEVAKRFPNLEALHVVVLLAEFTSDTLLAACQHLRLFKCLKYITCVATSPEEATLAEEKEIANKWHQHCPSLQTIILPRGRVWFQAPAPPPLRGKAWACFEDKE
ncbi:hypothetical protein BKA70DRAFT_1108409 [Coprinopsis sp. MPI-PUGE-AT-0042]|nr:hypothetical protein BKA70DRAFT_1108409 [Coprinopsis sp. MPI-PUGE-AT-0042]